MKKFRLSLYLLCLILLLNACSTGSLATFGNTKELVVDENLPRLENVKTLSDMSNIAFEWEPLYSENIQGFYLYRASQDSADFKLVATVRNKFQTHYVDMKLRPATKYRYMMKSFNEQGHISEQGQLIEAMTTPRIEAVPFVKAITNLPNRIKLIWRPHTDLRVKSYIIERAKTDDNRNFKKIAEVQNRLNAEYIDENLKPGENFWYRIVAVSFDGVTSEFSQSVHSTSKALPPQIENINASTDGSNSIIVTWNANNYKDFSYYKIYTTNSSLLPYTLLAKTQSNSYEDKVEGAGRTKYYKVTMVDQDGLESVMPKEGVMGKTLGIPTSPSIILAQSSDSGVYLEWIDNDERAVEYEVKRYGDGQTTLFKGIKEKRLQDIKALPEVQYSYEIIAIDSAGLRSEPSKKVKAVQ
ncbi:ferrous iron transporter A [Campylobacter sp. MIT 21-1685]|uniref:fibronectin type III domain-containing protein n=1 Tax=unclassified Campylobacter TaxID=2593542 RepID=UPI00224A4A53|nr:MULTISPECIES: ferrous iron transporter A [unclassified Campylobacter]MCX2682458.1 ferrous iron transporter A [Campylobacter sp. MIT 21-1684]MCX2750829.1 ferrous iron transporter A [Campylobacter sp. MIT 21-1682]MCX2806939.1 ferrous iron transporter A [Campylobacter sp. MIT 21-1685]